MKHDPITLGRARHRQALQRGIRASGTEASATRRHGKQTRNLPTRHDQHRTRTRHKHHHIPPSHTQRRHRNGERTNGDGTRKSGARDFALLDTDRRPLHMTNEHTSNHRYTFDTHMDDRSTGDEHVRELQTLEARSYVTSLDPAVRRAVSLTVRTAVGGHWQGSAVNGKHRGRSVGR